MRVLVLTGEPITAVQLREALPEGIDAKSAEVMVVAPALQEGPLKFWLSDADDAIARAEEVSRSTVGELGEAGVAATGNTGESDPLKAVEDALSTFSADRIVVFAHPDDQQRYREDFGPDEVKERFGLPVDWCTVSA